jgi:aryl-alcohol dehydrogenase-like predicted oxidoreductase
MDRRDFLRGAATLAALGEFWTTQAKGEAQQGAADQQGKPLGANAKGPAEVREGDMLYRTLGATGQRVSAIGVGGFHIGIPREKSDGVKIVRTAVDRGITFMDNCWDYHDGKSEEWMGEALRDGYREKVFLMTKIDGRTREAAEKQINESLKRLQTDRVDLMQIHENIRMEDADRVFAEGGAMEALQAARKAGKIRYIGFTGHKDPLVHNRMLDVADQHKFHFDSAQMPINILDASFRSFSQHVVPRLIKNGIALLGMKPMANGAIVREKIATPKECLTYALTLPTSVVITGMDSMDVLEQNLEIVKNYKALDGGAMRELLARTLAAAESGKYEQFKTSSSFDGTAKHPEWLG